MFAVYSIGEKVILKEAISNNVQEKVLNTIKKLALKNNVKEELVRFFISCK